MLDPPGTASLQTVFQLDDSQSELREQNAKFEKINLMFHHLYKYKLAVCIYFGERRFKIKTWAQNPI